MKQQSGIFRRRLPLVVVIALFLITLPGLAAPVAAQGIWRGGIITRVPWLDKYRYIEVDGKRYTFMPDTALHRQERDANGMYHEIPITFRNILIGQQVKISIQGRRIYQLLVVGLPDR
ncbi:MAG: hypothetical protein JW781_01670 [Deltaproteobacteria bacterium]|nr:hypothetical protein [Candidatus Anaeroferrophillacea bacterium]